MWGMRREKNTKIGWKCQGNDIIPKFTTFLLLLITISPLCNAAVAKFSTCLHLAPTKVGGQRPLYTILSCLRWVNINSQFVLQKRNANNFFRGNISNFEHRSKNRFTSTVANPYLSFVVCKHQCLLFANTTSCIWKDRWKMILQVGWNTYSDLILNLPHWSLILF